MAQAARLFHGANVFLLGCHFSTFGHRSFLAAVALSLRRIVRLYTGLQIRLGPQQDVIKLGS